MSKLSDLHYIILSAASRRADGCVHPLPDAATHPAGTAKSLATLIKRGLLEQRDCDVKAHIWRSEGEQHWSLHISEAGLRVLGIEVEGEDAVSLPVAVTMQTGKAATVLDLLRREEGAIASELVEATGWLPHTVRAFLSGLRRKGHVIDRRQRGASNCWHVRENG